MIVTGDWTWFAILDTPGVSHRNEVFTGHPPRKAHRLCAEEEEPFQNQIIIQTTMTCASSLLFDSTPLLNLS